MGCTSPTKRRIAAASAEWQRNRSPAAKVSVSRSRSASTTSLYPFALGQGFGVLRTVPPGLGGRHMRVVWAHGDGLVGGRTQALVVVVCMCGDMPVYEKWT